MAIPLAQTTFTPAEMKAFEPAFKIGLLATVTPEGLPHLTLISSLMAGTPTSVLFGQFIEGRSKEYVRQNPRAAFLIMTLDRQLWRGQARWTHTATSGPEFEWFNNVPMFRYNAYFGIHTVHFMDLVGHTGQSPLPMNAIVQAALKTTLARALAPSRGAAPSRGTAPFRGAAPARRAPAVMNAWTRAFFTKMDNLKFLAWVGEDGFPWIVPVIQAQADGGGQIALSTSVYSPELARIPTGATVAVLGLALTMEDVLVRGTYLGAQRQAGVQAARVAVDWVYNPMPPAPCQIYPAQELKPVTQF